MKLLDQKNPQHIRTLQKHKELYDIFSEMYYHEFIQDNHKKLTDSEPLTHRTRIKEKSTPIEQEEWNILERTKIALGSDGKDLLDYFETRAALYKDEFKKMNDKLKNIIAFNEQIIAVNPALASTIKELRQDLEYVQNWMRP